MKATVNWQDGMRFSGETDTGHKLALDGDGNCLTPMEAVLLSVGTCSSIDVVEILKKARQQVSSCKCELSGERADTAPRVFRSIHAHFELEGQDLSDKHVARAVNLSTQKYCSVMLMLAGNVEITTSYKLN
jgi:putative redox protein